MYEAHWNLESRPFESGSDSRFYYPGASHQGALLKLRYAVENRRAAAVLCGPAGLGKTLLVQALAKQLGETYLPVVHLVFPQMPSDELLAYLADEIEEGVARAAGQSGQGSTDATAGDNGNHGSAASGLHNGDPYVAGRRFTVEQSVRRLRHALGENARGGRHAVVIVDEAHLLAASGALETMRLLLNFEHESRPTMTLILVGAPSLLPALARFPELDSRMAVKCLLRSFTPEESLAYIDHRLSAAGARQPIFDRSAIHSVHALCGGNPQRINRLCDLALLIGYAEELHGIGAPQVEAIAQDLVAVTPE
jgi:general secretion pathway protein A